MKTVTLLVICFLVLGIMTDDPLLFEYHNYNKMSSLLKQLNQRYPRLTHLYSIGKSVQGRELWVMLISRFPDKDPLLWPNVKYVANMHGNEAIGRELMLHLIVYLLSNYPTDYYVKALVDNTRIHIMPSMNPDGFEMSREGQCSTGQGRYNARGYDLNRNFPDYFKTNNKQMQPETQAIMDWIAKIQFVLSGNLHGGALVASYPYDNTPNSIHSRFTQSQPSLTPDNDVFQHLALVYSFNHKTMHQGIACKDGSPNFPNGTTNGAAWYPLTGGMQDFNYVWGGCMEVTFELSCCKYPYKQRLKGFWDENKDALIKYLGEVHRGVKGLVVDVNNKPISKANLSIKGRNSIFRTTARGEYWRILLPGIYTLVATAQGFRPVEKLFAVNDQSVTILNITMYELSRAEATTVGTWHLFVDSITKSETSPTYRSTTVKFTYTSGDGDDFEELDDVTVHVIQEDITERSTSSTIEEPFARAVSENGALTCLFDMKLTIVWIFILEIIIRF